MAIGSHNILSKCDRALVAYLIDQGAGTADNTFPGKRSLDKPLPVVKCACSRAAWNDAFYEVDAAVEVVTDPSIDTDDAEGDPKNASETLVSAVFDALLKGIDSNGEGHELAAAITAAARATSDTDLASFTIQNVSVLEVEAGYVKENAWMDRMNLKLIAVPFNGS